jgi:adenosylcobinamide-phosphate synthase
VANWFDPLLRLLSPGALALQIAVLADLAAGDPVYAWHPVRLIGRLLAWQERQLRSRGFDGYGGGILLFLCLSASVLIVVLVAVAGANLVSPALAWLLHVVIAYSLLALGDLLRHVWRIEAAVRGGDVVRARLAVSALVGRDTDRMDGPACRRAAVESLSENLTDGVISPLCWYLAGGLPGLMLFKVVSTMDSMVGYKTDRYLRFGWCGARLDDVMNYLPARLTWLLIAAIAAVLPRYSGRKAWRVGLHQHQLLLGPNSGWSEAATAGALERRIVGPIWLKGALVTDLWIGEPADPPLGSAGDTTRAMILVALTGLLVAGVGSALLR